MLSDGDSFFSSEFDGITDNLLIYGENLHALRILEDDYAEKVRCIYIDPPYNTKSRFTHYDDSMESSVWLNMMKERIEILRKLLRDDGIIFVSIDDSEDAYLKVLMDDIFGRKNFCGRFVWEKKKKPSFLSSSMGVVTEYILSYSKNRKLSPSFLGGHTTENKRYPLNNSGNNLSILKFPANRIRFHCEDQTLEPQDMSSENIITRLLDRVVIRNGINVNSFSLEGEWRYSQRKLDEIISNGEIVTISKLPFRPNHIKQGNKPKKIRNLLSRSIEIPTYEDATQESRLLFGSTKAFDYPKPEKLIYTLINAVTEPGDIVLDCFAGSGTTGAVAHKMGRRWIMIEMGDHAVTHIIPRLQMVIDGTDSGGVTASTGWQGGGGFFLIKN